MKINNRRKKSAYLDYQYGEVVPIDEQQEFQDTTTPPIEDVEFRGRKISLTPFYVIFSLMLGLIICIFLFIQSYMSVTTTAKVFNFLGSGYISASAYNENYLENKKEEIMNGSNKIHFLDFEGQKVYNTKKNDAKQLMENISTYDKYLMSYYNTLKTNIHAYRRGKSSYYIMNSSLESLTNTVTYDYNTLMKTEFSDDDIKLLFVSRYKILLSYLSEQTDNFTPSSLITATNKTISEDNKYNVQEYSQLKQYLKDNGISYICENNKIRVV